MILPFNQWRAYVFPYRLNGYWIETNMRSHAIDIKSGALAIALRREGEKSQIRRMVKEAEFSERPEGGPLFRLHTGGSGSANLTVLSSTTELV